VASPETCKYCNQVRDEPRLYLHANHGLGAYCQDPFHGQPTVRCPPQMVRIGVVDSDTGFGIIVLIACIAMLVAMWTVGCAPAPPGSSQDERAERIMVAAITEPARCVCAAGHELERREPCRLFVNVDDRLVILAHELTGNEEDVAGPYCVSHIREWVETNQVEP